MARPKRKRLIETPPAVDGFKPFGVPMKSLEPVILLYEEYEAMRLADYLGLNQEQAAEKMNVSRPTFTRIYEKARTSIAKAFIEGKAIMIEGGNYHSKNYWYRCEHCMNLTISKRQRRSCGECKTKKLRLLNAECHGSEI